MSFIDPNDTVIQVFVARSQFAFSGSNLPSIVHDASVSISDGITTIHLQKGNNRGLMGDSIPDKNFSVYEWKVNSDFIKAGNTYFLSVSTPYGEKSDATCTVLLPSDSNFLTEINTRVVSSYYTFDAEPQLVELRNSSLKFRLLNGLETGYYTISASFIHRLTTITSKWIQTNNSLTSLVSDTLEKKNSEPYKKSGFFSESLKIYNNDILRNREISFEFDDYSDTPFYYVYDYNGRKFCDCIFHRSPEFLIFLTRVDENYYKYHQSVANFSGENIFAEASKVYTNIENGFGVFASKNTRIIPVK